MFPVLFVSVLYALFTYFSYCLSLRLLEWNLHEGKDLNGLVNICIQGA